ncbi:MAG: SemiSWEET family transporter [Thermoplasmatota archaeon]
MTWTQMAGLLGVLILSLSGVPQLIKIMKTKSVRDLSLPFFLLLLTGVVLLTAYTLAIENLIYTIGNAITFVVTLIIIGAILVWR